MSKQWRKYDRDHGSKSRTAKPADFPAFDGERHLVCRTVVLVRSVVGIGRRSAWLRVDFDLLVDEVHDPVNGDASTRVEPFLGAPVALQAGVCNLDDQGDVPGTGMAVQVLPDVTPHYHDAGFRLAVFEGDWILDAHVPAGRNFAFQGLAHEPCGKSMARD